MTSIYRPLTPLQDKAFVSKFATFQQGSPDIRHHLTVIMPRQLYPGELKFHIIDEEARQAKRKEDTRRRMINLRKQRLKKQQHDSDAISQQIEEANQAKRRASSQTQMANLRERRLKELQYNNDISEQLIAEQAIKRYDYNFRIWSLHTDYHGWMRIIRASELLKLHGHNSSKIQNSCTETSIR